MNKSVLKILASISDPVFRARQEAVIAHSGQVDLAGKDYMGHVNRVAASVSGDVLKQVAYLHDVIEDSDVSAVDLRSLGFSPDVIAAVVALTKPKGQKVAFGHPYYDRVKANALARIVKLADIADNMDPSRIPYPSEKDDARRRHYAKIRVYLMG